MRQIRELMRLKFSGCNLSDREISHQLNIARSTVQDYLKRAATAGLTWPLPKRAEEVMDEDAKANVTDPASRIMKGRKGYLQGYNAQAVVTVGQIILAADVTNQANDVQQLTPMIAKTLAVMEAVVGEEVDLGTGLFDAGYF